jgi:hypothetical protein
MRERKLDDDGGGDELESSLARSLFRARPRRVVVSASRRQAGRPKVQTIQLFCQFAGAPACAKLLSFASEPPPARPKYHHGDFICSRPAARSEVGGELRHVVRWWRVLRHQRRRPRAGQSTQATRRRQYRSIITSMSDHDRGRAALLYARRIAAAAPGPPLTLSRAPASGGCQRQPADRLATAPASITSAAQGRPQIIRLARVRAERWLTCAPRASRSQPQIIQSAPCARCERAPGPPAGRD